jgi:hypothetical protein
MLVAIQKGSWDPKKNKELDSSDDEESFDEGLDQLNDFIAGNHDGAMDSAIPLRLIVVLIFVVKKRPLSAVTKTMSNVSNAKQGAKSRVDGVRFDSNAPKAINPLMTKPTITGTALSSSSTFTCRCFPIVC